MINYEEAFKNPVIAANSTKIFELLLEASKRTSIPVETDVVSPVPRKSRKRNKASEETI